MITQLLRLTRHEIEVALRTRRVLLIAFLYIGAAIVGGLGISAAAAKAEQAIIETTAERTGLDEAALRAELAENGQEALEEMLDEFGIATDVIAQPLRSSIVAPVFFWCSLAFLPLLIALSTFDTLASDLRGRTLCYTTLRAPRWATVVAKGAAWWAIVSVITAICAFIVFGAASRMLRALELGVALRSAVWVAIAVLPFIAAWVAFALWCSSTTDKPMAALVRAFLLMIALRLFTLPNALIGSVIEEGSPMAVLRHLRWLSPSAHNRGLWHMPDLDLARSVLAFLAFAAFFTWAAVTTVRRRDL